MQKDDSETTNTFPTFSLVLSKKQSIKHGTRISFNIIKDRVEVVNENINQWLCW